MSVAAICIEQEEQTRRRPTPLLPRPNLSFSKFLHPQPTTTTTMSTSDLSAVPRQQVGLAAAAALKEAVFIEYDYHLISHFPPPPSPLSPFLIAGGAHLKFEEKWEFVIGKFQLQTNRRGHERTKERKSAFPNERAKSVGKEFESETTFAPTATDCRLSFPLRGQN